MLGQTRNEGNISFHMVWIGELVNEVSMIPSLSSRGYLL